MKNEECIFYRRRLPHYQPDDSTYFVTCRLFGSLPTTIITQLREEQKLQEAETTSPKDAQKRKILLSESRTRYFGKFDAWLDKASSGPR